MTCTGATQAQPLCDLTGSLKHLLAPALSHKHCKQPPWWYQSRRSGIGRTARGGKGDSRLSLAFSLCGQRRCRAVQTLVISYRCAANKSPKAESTGRFHAPAGDGNTALTQSRGQARGTHRHVTAVPAWLVSSKKDPELN